MNRHLRSKTTKKKKVKVDQSLLVMRDHQAKSAFGNKFNDSVQYSGGQVTGNVTPHTGTKSRPQQSNLNLYQSQFGAQKEEDSVDLDIYKTGPNYEALKHLQQQLGNENVNLTLSELGLESMNFLMTYNHSNLKTINISQNNIADIDLLQLHQNLEYIDASNNQIEKIKILQLPKLEVLYLQHNSIEKFPGLQGMESLKILNLSNNKLKHLKNHKPSETPNLEELHIDHNEIEMKRSHWYYWSNAISELELLRILNFNDNPFLQLANWLEFNEEKVPLIKADGISVGSSEEDEEGLHPIIFTHSLVKRMDCLEIVNGQEVDEIQVEIEEVMDCLNESERFEALKEFVEKHAEDDDGGSGSDKEEEKGDTSKMKEQAGAGKEQAKVNKREQKPPTLQILLQTLEQVDLFNGEEDELDELWDDQVFKVLKLILERKDVINKRLRPQNKKVFMSGLKHEESIELTEQFFQICLSLLDKHPNYHERTLEVLAKCTFIEDHIGFGHLCFQTLMEIMQFNNKLCNTVEDIVEQHIIHELNEREMIKYPAILFEDLKQFIEIEPENYTAMLKFLYDNIRMRDWVEDISEIITEKVEEGAPDKYEENADHYNAILALMAISVQGSRANNPCIQEFEDAELVEEVFNIVKASKKTDARYQPCLMAIASLANNDQDLAEGFVDLKLDDMMREEIEPQIREYLANDGVLNTDPAVDLNFKREQYEVLETQLSALGGLFNADDNEGVIDESEELLVNLMRILRRPYNDPILLKACCNIAKDLFETDYMIKDKAKMEIFYLANKGRSQYYEPLQDYEQEGELNFFEELIPYLGGKKYQKLLQITRSYAQAQEEAQNNIFSESGAEMTAQKTHLTVKDESTLNIDMLKKVKAMKTSISIQKLNDPIVFQLFEKIILLMSHFSLHGSLDTNEHFDQCSRMLKDLNRNEALFQAMQINDDDVRLACVGCLYVIPMEELNYADFGKIVNLLKKATSVDEGKTELVLASLFQILSNFIFEAQNEESVELSLYFQNTYGMETIDIALKFLKQNTARFVQDDEETDMEKQALSQAIVNYIKVSSNSPQMYNTLVGRELDLKQILINEEVNASPAVKTNPVDIETSVLGQDIYGLMQCITGVESLTPYTDTSMRVIMSMADLLMNFYHCHKYNLLKAKQTPPDDVKDDDSMWFEKVIADADQIATKINQKQTLIVNRRKKLENKFWVDIPRDFQDQMKKKEHERHKEQHHKFTKGNGIGLLLQFMIARFPVNEEMLFFLTDHKLRDCVPANSEENVHPLILDLNLNASVKKQIPLLDQVQEKQYRLYGKAKKKYIGDDSLVKMHDELKKSQVRTIDSGQIKETAREKRDKMANKWAYEACQHSYFLDFRKGLQIEQNSVPMEQQGGFDKEFLNSKLQEQFNNVKEWKESEELEWTAMDHRNDGFQNVELRKLSVAAMLRCIYASIECAPSLDLKLMAIQNLSSVKVFRSISQLCDSTDWDQESNIISKYFRLARHVVKLKTVEDRENPGRLELYEILSVVISQTMTLIQQRLEECMQQEPNDPIKLQELKEVEQGLKVATYELSYVLFTMVQQVSHLVFFQFDLVRLNRENEIKRMYVKSGDMEIQEIAKVIQKLIDVGGSYSNKRLFDKTQVMKCDYMKHVKKHHCVSDESRLVQKRSIQMKCVEFILLKLVSVETVKQLIGTLFLDMDGDAEIFEEAKEFEEKIIHRNEGPEEKLHNSETTEEVEIISDIEEASQELSDSSIDEEDGDGGSEVSSFKDDSECDVEEMRRFGQDIEEFVDLKSGLNIEKTKDIVAMLIATCQKTMQFDIQNFFMRGIVFEDKKLRPSFMQEVLRAADNAKNTIALQAYLNENVMTVGTWGQQSLAQELKPHELQDLIREKQPGEPVANDTKKVRIICVSQVRINLTALELLDVTHHSFRVNEQKLNQDDPKDSQKVHEQKMQNLRIIREQNQNWEEQHFRNLRVNTYQNRLLVLTNQGIQVLIELPQDKMCPNCNPALFCPKGPKQNICIKLTDIEDIVLFAMLPQKMVIVYRCPNVGQQGEDDGFLKQQLTLNIPIFTSSSRLAENLIENWDQMREELSYNKDWTREVKWDATQKIITESKNEPLFECEFGKVYPFFRDVQDLVFNDKMVEYYLIMLLEQVLDAEYDQWDILEKENFQAIEMTQVELLDTNIVRPKFLDKKFKIDKQKSKFTDVELQSRLGNKYYEIDPMYDQANEEKQRFVYILQYKSNLLFLKEKWENWQLIKNSESCKAEVKRVRDASHYSFAQKDGLNKTSRSSVHSHESLCDHYQEEIEQRCQEIKNELFDVVLWVDLQNLDEEGLLETSQVHVHKGKDPTCRVMADQKHYVDLLFPGDMERQIFIGKMFEAHKERVAPTDGGLQRQNLVDLDKESDDSVLDLAESVHAMKKNYD